VLRVGVVDYLNSKPLAWGLLQGRHADRFAVGRHSPARVAELLAQGDLDVGLVPSIELQRIPDLRVLPGLCIAATHEARSVLLVSRRPLGEVRRVALDEASRTSAALLRIVLADGYGVRPEYASRRADPEAMLADFDAALLIGDPALRVERERWLVWDLAAEWRRLTGLPFVFAVWAARPTADLPDLAGYFHDSLRHGLDSLEAIVAEATAALGLQPAEVEEYLTRNLRFELRAPEVAGLAEFHRRAHRHGLIEAPRPLVFWPEPVAAAAG
jgi:chorismate dehydratase